MSQILYHCEKPEGSGRVMFFCPGCQCGHYVNTKGNHPVWGWNGSMDKPTFTPSILVTYDGADKQTRCHSFVTDGNIQFLSDCSHALAGKTVPLEAF